MRMKVSEDTVALIAGRVFTTSLALGESPNVDRVVYLASLIAEETERRRRAGTNPATPTNTDGSPSH